MSSSARQFAGNSIAEVPAVLWLVLVVMLFPLANFCTLGIRSIFVFNACSQAALAASKARSYDTGTTEAPSAKQLAQQIAQASFDTWPGIKLNSVQTQIISTKIADQTQSKQAAKLTAAPDTALNTYQVEVTIKADIDPIFQAKIPFLDNIAGISAPYQMQVSQRNFVENTQGLTR